MDPNADTYRMNIGGMIGEDWKRIIDWEEKRRRGEKDEGREEKRRKERKRR